MKNTAVNLYNPGQKEKETLINEFVIRGKEFKTIIDDVRNSKMDVPEQHYLITGQRGMGKTTLLWRILYAVEDNPKLNKKLVPVIFGEEQYNIFSLSQFWEETAIYLGNKYTEYGSLYKKMVEHEENENYLGICFEILEKALKTNKQHIVVLMDNLGYLLDKISEKEAHFFRKTLMTSNIIRIIATSSVVLEHTFRYDKPFFEFFYEMRLEPLDRKASLDLLKALAEVHGKSKEITTLIENEPNRIEALRRITGGVPRTMALLFEIFMDNSKGDSFEYLQELTDKVTALYKHRMDGLKPQQQQILDALARAWEPIGTQEILKRSKLYRKNIQSNQISAQLKQLSDNQLIEIVHLTGKKKAYRIRERFFNIWYLMRYGRKNSKEQILFLIRFFEDWCNVPDLINMSKEMQQGFENGKGGFSPHGAYYKSLALLETKDLPENEKNILREKTVKYLMKADFPNLAHQLVKQTTKEALKLFTYAYNKHLNKSYSEAIKYYKQAVKGGIVFANYNLAHLYEEQGNIVEAEKYYLQSLADKIEMANNSLAILYQKQGKTEKAEKYYLQAIKREDFYARANLIILYLNNSKFPHAIKILKDMADAKKDEDDNKIFQQTIMYFLSFKQYEVIYQIFKEYSLKEELLPLYYALMYFMQDKFPNEYLKTNPEIKETVNEIIEVVKKEQERIFG